MVKRVWAFIKRTGKRGIERFDLQPQAIPLHTFERFETFLAGYKDDDGVEVCKGGEDGYLASPYKGLTDCAVTLVVTPARPRAAWAAGFEGEFESRSTGYVIPA